MEDRWAKLEEIVRRVVREELAASTKTRSKIGFKNGFFTGLGEIEMAALEATYPAVNVTEQIRAAATWIVMNPADAPRSNYGAFLNKWLTKGQNAHSLRSVGTQRDLQIVKKKACAYCGEDATGSIGPVPTCRAHVQDAMDGKPRRMLGVVPAPVAGRD